MTALKFVERLRDLVGGVDVLLSDIWGVVHNGLVAFPEACDALRNFRAQGGTVILITNAPVPRERVPEHAGARVPKLGRAVPGRGGHHATGFLQFQLQHGAIDLCVRASCQPQAARVHVPMRSCTCGSP